ncbi:MAG: HNH endonuclease, partial [Acidimicrobiia bacterium]
PATTRAFEHGSISIDELLVLSRFATAQNERDLLDLTREVGVEDLSAAVREFLDEPKPETEPPPRPSLRMWWDETSLQLRGSIPGADGVLVETALLRLAAKAPLDPTTGLFRDPDERYGEAVIQMASESTAEDRDHDRATVVVHVGLQELSGPDASVNIGGRTYGRDELMRMTCDGRLQPAIDDAGGVTIGIGRVSRQIPAWLRRTMNERDGGCRFPGCSRTRWTHGHHLVHWAQGGPTNLDNLITLCGFHHRLIHRQAWVLEGDPGGEVLFMRSGRPHVPARPQFPDYHQKSLVDQVSSYAEHRLGLLATANSPP